MKNQEENTINILNFVSNYLTKLDLNKGVVAKQCLNTGKNPATIFSDLEANHLNIMLTDIGGTCCSISKGKVDIDGKVRGATEVIKIDLLITVSGAWKSIKQTIFNVDNNIANNSFLWETASELFERTKILAEQLHMAMITNDMSDSTVRQNKVALLNAEESLDNTINKLNNSL